jgi:hypothetical protein
VSQSVPHQCTGHRSFIVEQLLDGRSFQDLRAETAGCDDQLVVENPSRYG